MNRYKGMKNKMANKTELLISLNNIELNRISVS